MDDTLLKEKNFYSEDIGDLILDDEDLAALEDEEAGDGLSMDVIADEDGDIIADEVIDENAPDAGTAEDAQNPEDAETAEDAENAGIAENAGTEESVENDSGMVLSSEGDEETKGTAVEAEGEAQPKAAAPQAAGTKIVVGVRFRSAGKSYYFAVGNLPVKRGSHVIVETSRGLDYGTSVCDPIELDRKQFKAPVKRIVRIATPADENRVQQMREKEHEAYRICYEKIRRRGLDMKLIEAEYAFDGSKILFYFTADERVDFRDLVKDLAGVFHTRIELRQIGVRDETRILGGYGICGRPLCCHTYLTDFAPVSIKMAKEQNLSLNPTKISGSCGRLMCCLKNEEEVYEELNKNLPKPGDEVEGNDGLTGEVIGVDILRQLVRMLVEVDDQKELHEYPADQITILRRRKRGQAKPKVNRSELRDPRSVRRGAAGAETAAGHGRAEGAGAAAEGSHGESAGSIQTGEENRRGEPVGNAPAGGIQDNAVNARGKSASGRRRRRAEGAREIAEGTKAAQESNGSVGTGTAAGYRRAEGAEDGNLSVKGGGTAAQDTGTAAEGTGTAVPGTRTAAEGSRRSESAVGERANAEGASGRSGGRRERTGSSRRSRQDNRSTREEQQEYLSGTSEGRDDAQGVRRSGRRSRQNVSAGRTNRGAENVLPKGDQPTGTRSEAVHSKDARREDTEVAQPREISAAAPESSADGAGQAGDITRQDGTVNRSRRRRSRHRSGVKAE